MSSEIPEYASVILLTPTGEIVLQLRDNNPAIVDPNALSLFAGRLLENEAPKVGALRELEEETTLRLQPDELEYFMTYQTTMERHGRVSRSHTFIARNIDPKRVDIREGQGYRTIKSAADLEKYDFALISKDILAEYFKRQAGPQED